MIHTIPIRVYYEDTDADGVVYHGAYIYMAERGRTEYLRSEGTSIREVNEKLNITFVVRHLEIDYLKTAALDDLLELRTSVVKLKNSSFIMKQEFFRKDAGEETKIATVNVTLVCVDTNAIKPLRMPTELREIFKCQKPSP